MKKKNIRFLTGLMTAALLLGNAMPVFAADISVSGDNATGSTPTEFSVDADTLGGGLVVTIPASLDLVQDASGDYTVNDVVSAYGNMSLSKKLWVSTDADITYINSSDTSITINGDVTFGVGGIEEWTAEQTKNSLTELDSRDIEVKVDADNVGYIGEYSTNVIFDISLVDVDLVHDDILAASFTWSTNETAGTATVTGLADGITDGYLTIPATYSGLSVTGVGNNAFVNNSVIKSITIPATVVSISDNVNFTAFGGSSLETAVFADGATIVPDRAFKNAKNLTDVTIPEGVERIGGNAFLNCTSLTDITIPSTVTSIGGNNDAAFYGSGLQNVVIAEGATNISDYAFKGCSNLTNITIPEGVMTIGNNAFYGCTSLTNVTIPSTVTSIGGQNTPAFANSGVTSAVFADGITAIPAYAFKNCTTLKSVVIPESVTTIGTRAFEGCTSLASVTIPEGVETIEGNAFYGCTGLTSITIPSSVTSISGNSNYPAFGNCTNVTSVVYNNTTYTTASDIISALQANGVSVTSNTFDGTGLN